MNTGQPSFLICFMSYAVLFHEGGHLDRLILTTPPATLSLHLHITETQRWRAWEGPVRIRCPLLGW